MLPRDFDADPWLLNCANGTVDLRTGELRAHDRADLLTCLSPVSYDLEAGCPIFEKFVYKIQANNIRVYDFLQRVLGYALTGSTQEQCLFILWGSGANGKSTLINLVTRLLGNYARNTPVETLLAKKQSGEIPTDVARLDAKEVEALLLAGLMDVETGLNTIDTALMMNGETPEDLVKVILLCLQVLAKPLLKQVGVDSSGFCF